MNVKMILFMSMGFIEVNIVEISAFCDLFFR